VTQCPLVNEWPHLPGGDIDRLPFIFILHVGEHPSRLIGVSVTRYNHDSKLMAEAQLAVFRECGPDSLGVGPGLFGIAEPWGPILNSRRMVLDRYYMESRYPNNFPEGSPQDFFDEKIAKEAYNAAGKIVGFCENIIGRL